MKRTLSSFNLRRDYRSELDSQCRQNFSYCPKFGIPSRAKRFIKTFSGQAALPSYFGHTFSLSYVKDGRLNQRAVAGIVFKARLKVQGIILFAFKIINRVIRLAKLDLVHRLNLHFQKYLFCSFDVFGLSFFRTSKQKQNNDLSAPSEINSVARSEINFALYDTFTNRACLAKMAVGHIPQPGIDSLKSNPIIGFKGIQPLLKLLCRIKSEILSFLKHNVSYIPVNYSLHYTVIAALSLLLYTGISFADDFGELAKRCAPEVSEDTLRALVRTESSFNPYAIGIVGGGSRQPKAFHEAMAIIAQLELEGKNYSVGLAQINKKNFSKLGINAAGALDACTNLKAASKILSDCYQRAQKNSGSNSLHDALSCYYSGNFQTGYRHSYVDKVRANAGINVNVQTVPSIREAETKSKESSTLVATGDNSLTGLIF